MPTACVLAALVSAAASEAAEITYETRALTGTDGPLGPGLGAGVNFSGLSAPQLNSAGQTAFLGVLAGPGVDASNDSGIYSEGGGVGLTLVVREGDSAPGTVAGVNFRDFGPPVLNAAGQTAFRGFLIGAGVNGLNNDGIWSEDGGSGLTLVARRGNPAPGTAAGVNFAGLNNPALNAAGQTAFGAFLIGPEVTTANNEGIWSEGGGSGLALIAREGDSAPDSGIGVNFSETSFNFAAPLLNGAGHTAFRGTLSGSGVSGANDGGIWSEGGGTGLALVAREGNNAPGTEIGESFGNLSAPAVNDAGQIAFFGVLSGAEVTSMTSNAIWSEGGGSGLALVARAGDNAPGTTAGVTFLGLSPPVINGAGQTAFRGSLSGTGVTPSNDFGIWSQGSGPGLTLVVREGSQAPGTAADVVFSELSARPVLNGAGQTAFTGGLTTDLGVDPASDGGIWATDRDGVLQLIAREGDLLDVSNDPDTPDPRTISSLTMLIGSGGEDGRGTNFNDAGQLAFFASFTDGSSGIFVATIGGDSTTPFAVTIAPAIAPASGFNFAWNSQPGKVYDLVTSTDLATPVTQWPIHASYGDIPATGTTTTLTAVPADGPQRFFAVVEK